MTAVAEQIAPLLVLERIVTQMQANYATALADASIALDGLDLPAPGVEDYHLVLEQQDAERRVQSERVTVYVWHAQPNTIQARGFALATPSVRTKDQLVYVRIMIAFRQTNAAPLEHLGQTELSQQTIAAQRAHRYAGAAKLVAYERFCGAAGIKFVDVADDYVPQATYEPDTNSIRAHATITVAVTQAIETPLPRS